MPVYNEELLEWYSTNRNMSNNILRRLSALRAHTDAYSYEALRKERAEIVELFAEWFLFWSTFPLLSSTDDWDGYNRNSPRAFLPALNNAVVL